MSSMKLRLPQNKEIKMQKHRFSIMVNCYIPDETAMTDQVQDFEECYEDHGFIILPDQYSEDGAPTRLVINCHGAGGWVMADDAVVEHSNLTQYLVANGYAVMDVNGLPEEYAAMLGVDIRYNIGSPIAVRSYVKAYHYCMEHFNLYPEVFIQGGSMGGLSGANLVLSGCIPVIAHSAFCPLLDPYNGLFLRQTKKGLGKDAICKLYRFEKDENGEYIYDERKLKGFDPFRNQKAACYPVPVKFWHCVDDHVVDFEITQKFVDRIKENGGIAYLRALPYGKHGPKNVGTVQNPCGNTKFGDEEIEITPAVEEAFIWIRNFS